MRAVVAFASAAAKSGARLGRRGLAMVLSMKIIGSSNCTRRPSMSVATQRNAKACPPTQGLNSVWPLPPVAEAGLSGGLMSGVKLVTMRTLLNGNCRCIDLPSGVFSCGSTKLRSRSRKMMNMRCRR